MEDDEDDISIPDFTYDEPEVYTSPAVAKFGDSTLVNVVHDSQQLRQLVQDGHTITARAVLAASYIANAEGLEVLLSASGVDPNIRLETADAEKTGVDPSWASSDISPKFGVDKREWYPLHHIAKGNTHAAEQKPARSATAQILLRQQPNLYALFRQPLWRSLPFPFPGEAEEEKAPWTSAESIGREHGVSLRGMIDGEWQRYPTPERGYGLRTLVHALFEDGAFVEPLFTRPELKLDVEHRDPQGRTLLHACSRNALGADAKVDAMSEDLFCFSGEKEDLIASPDTASSLFRSLLGLGADLHAVDHAGNNVLHHLLEARASHPYTFTHLPFIRNSVHYIIKNAPILINQPDKHGTYPLHTALQRFRHFTNIRSSIDIDHMEPLVHDLLDAGANPEVKDSRGNTALHYFADTGLVERSDTDPQRILAECFFAHKVDVNASNAAGRTAVELALGDFDYMQRGDILWHMPTFRRQSAEEVELEVLEKFDQAGAQWQQLNSRGETLLHGVAGQQSTKAAFRARYLLGKGVNAGVGDNNGRPAIDVARLSGNEQVLKILEDSQG